MANDAMAVVSTAVIVLETVGETIIFIITISILTRIYQIRIFYYAICVETIRIELRGAYLEVKEATTSIKVLGRVRHTYQHIFNMVRRVETIFGYSQLTLISYSFFQLIIDCNWYNVHFQETDLVMQSGEP